jgi:hypothetical protein
VSAVLRRNEVLTRQQLQRTRSSPGGEVGTDPIDLDFFF